jgi:hypothetical protein
MFKPTSVDSIIRVFTKMIADLENLKGNLISDNTEKYKTIDSNNLEIDKATKVLTKLKEIV